MSEISAALVRWQMDETALLERVYRSPTPRERERWHALWLLAQDRTVAKVAELLRRDAHTIAGWLTLWREDPRPLRLSRRVVPPALDAAEQTALKEVVQGSPQAAGLAWANWCWKAVRQFILALFGKTLSRTTCLDSLHRLGFVLKRPGKRLPKADAEKREAFVSEYQKVRREAEASGAQIFFVDEAHFRADVEVRQMWVQRGEQALIDSTSPQLGEKATYYSAICLETGEVQAMAVEESCTAETTVAFLQQLRDHYTEPLVIIWDNGPAHRGAEIRTWLSTPDLHVRLVALPAYNPDFNADEAIWDWVREEATANTCFGQRPESDRP